MQELYDLEEMVTEFKLEFTNFKEKRQQISRNTRP